MHFLERGSPEKTQSIFIMFGEKMSDGCLIKLPTETGLEVKVLPY